MYFEDFDRLTEARFSPEEIAAADASVHTTGGGALNYDNQVQRDLIMYALEVARDDADDLGDRTELEILIGRL